MCSLIACDPWHLVTSMGQYLLMAPIYINLLNIYAFSNLHDFSWGTKEDARVDVDLGVTTKISNDTVNMALPSDQNDIDIAYDTSLHNLKTRPMIVPPPLSNKAKEEQTADYYQSVRTNVLLAWVLSNALLVTTILKGDYANTFSNGGGNGRTQICSFRSPRLSPRCPSADFPQTEQTSSSSSSLWPSCPSSGSSVPRPT